MIIPFQRKKIGELCAFSDLNDRFVFFALTSFFQSEANFVLSVHQMNQQRSDIEVACIDKNNIS